MVSKDNLYRSIAVLIVNTEIKGKRFACPEFTLREDGVMRIRRGRKWDGCSPKFKIGDIGYIGAPDGVIVNGSWRVTGKASLLHDLLLKYRKEIGITQEIAASEFERQLKKDNFSLKILYVLAVKAYWRIRKLLRLEK